MNDHLKLLRLDEAAIFRWLTDIETFVMEQLYPLYLQIDNYECILFNLHFLILRSAFAPEDCNDFEMDEKIYTRLELLSKINLQNLLEAHPIMKSPIKETVQESSNQCDLGKATNHDFDKDLAKTANDEEEEENLGIFFPNNHAQIDFTINPQIMIKLIEFHHERAPFRKIQRLTEIFKILGNPSNTEDGNILNTDTLLPLLIVHIVKTNPPRLISNIRYSRL